MLPWLNFFAVIFLLWQAVSCVMAKEYKQAWIMIVLAVANVLYLAAAKFWLT